MCEAPAAQCERSPHNFRRRTRRREGPDVFRSAPLGGAEQGAPGDRKRLRRPDLPRPRKAGPECAACLIGTWWFTHKSKSGQGRGSTSASTSSTSRGTCSASPSRSAFWARLTSGSRTSFPRKSNTTSKIRHSRSSNLKAENRWSFRRVGRQSTAATQGTLCRFTEIRARWMYTRRRAADLSQLHK